MKKQKKTAYIQDWGTYTNQTIVTVGMTPKDILVWMKKNKVDKKFIEAFKKDINVVSEEWMNPARHSAVLWSHDAATLLWFPDWKNDWKHLDILVHELSHAIYTVIDCSKKMANEDEAKAYQLEFLFREIRRKLWKLLP